MSLFACHALSCDHPTTLANLLLICLNAHTNTSNISSLYHPISTKTPRKPSHSILPRARMHARDATAQRRTTSRHSLAISSLTLSMTLTSRPIAAQPSSRDSRCSQPGPRRPKGAFCSLYLAKDGPLWTVPGLDYTYWAVPDCGLGTV
ncbi:hypothetical protein EJ05DRAFT_27923 [Pseudovirgaria hyperparasitica]|uniref:Uncharacterized protein n=1 Tax=Pseudovirgaria hyperparasitica TaxID=470096 RepID=A0A6A6WMB3_9PEZI|nr:uncharacterized protein EJ05DRAFT_27923 [Pseudovirgaria hyperparasitica]KAF2763159.1 hypothetical protein EJ05DRAFT_27923 [Pseudovirgaria hyperparasitica]